MRVDFSLVLKARLNGITWKCVVGALRLPEQLHGVCSATFVYVAMLMVLLPSTVSGTTQPTCSSLTVQSDKDTYTLGQPVIITVTFHATLPGCAEPMFVHGYLLTIQVFNARNSEVYSWNHTVPPSANVTESWTPTVVGDFSINATSWVTIPGNEVTMKGLEVSKLIHVLNTDQSAATEAFLALAAIAILAVPAAFLTLGHKSRSSKLSPVESSQDQAVGQWAV